MKQTSNWVVAFASVIGNSHVKENLPLQDSCMAKNLTPDWGIAVVSDGAGSCQNSDKGSDYTVTMAIDKFEQLVYSQNWITDQTLPDKDTWHKLAKRTLKTVRDNLERCAESQEMEFRSLSCTVIAVIYSPFGLLVTHIGDGRAGYCSHDDEWQSMITPYHGDEANETVFITSDIWHRDEIDQYVKSDVITTDLKAFCLLSDGCEKASFECNLFDAGNNMYIDPNKPYSRFFNPNLGVLRTLRKEGKSQQEINRLWEQFLTAGNDRLKTEPDDKTMILGVRLN